MVVFTRGLLVGTVRFTEKNTGALSAVYGTFHPFDVRKLMAIVGKDERETGSEHIPARGLFDDIQHADHGSGSVFIKDK